EFRADLRLDLKSFFELLHQVEDVQRAILEACHLQNLLPLQRAHIEVASANGSQEAEILDAIDKIDELIGVGRKKLQNVLGHFLEAFKKRGLGAFVDVHDVGPGLHIPFEIISCRVDGNVIQAYPFKSAHDD